MNTIQKSNINKIKFKYISSITAINRYFFDKFQVTV